jgi:hypothetical protein
MSIPHSSFQWAMNAACDYTRLRSEPSVTPRLACVYRTSVQQGCAETLYVFICCLPFRDDTPTQSVDLSTYRIPSDLRRMDSYLANWAVGIELWASLDLQSSRSDGCCLQAESLSLQRRSLEDCAFTAYAVRTYRATAYRVYAPLQGAQGECT